MMEEIEPQNFDNLLGGFDFALSENNSFLTDILERDIEQWKLPEIETFADPRIKGIRTQKKHKKRKLTGTLEQKFHHIPRILKNDIRRQYAVMFSNVYNSADYYFMNTFCTTFGRMDTSLSIVKREITEFREHHIGCDACGTIWYAAMNEAPDLVFTLNSNQLKLRSDGTSVVTAKFTLTGTKIFQIDDNELQHLQSLVSKSSQYQFLSNSSADNNRRSSNTSVLSSSSGEWSPSPSTTSEEDDNSLSAPHNASFPTPVFYPSSPPSPLSPIIANENEISPVSHEMVPAVCELAMILEFERRQKNINLDSLQGKLLTVPIAFKFDGQVAIHLDSDSKIHHIFLEVGKLA